MTRTLRMIVAVSLAAASLPALAQIEVEVFPPPAYIATATPVYVEGRPAYWWRHHWYYREGRRWAYYREEPAGLRGRQRDWERHRAYYGREHERGFRRR